MTKQKTTHLTLPDRERRIARMRAAQAFPWQSAPRYLLRDRDGVYGKHFRSRVQNLGIKEVLTAARSPWQSPYVERVMAPCGES